jgi:hypothetical protein
VRFLFDCIIVCIEKMNKYDCIRSLADGNAKAFRPFRSPEELKEQEDVDLDALKIPYFQITRDPVQHRYRLNSYNCAGHDNEPRMGFYCDYIEKHVMPHLSRDADVTGYYALELHDTYCYLDPQRREFYEKVPSMVFAKKSSDRMPVLVPDPYMIANFGNKLMIQDPVPFDQKIPTIFFAGGTTGSMDPLKNQRLRLAEWGQGIDDGKVRIGITNVVQMSQDAVAKAYGPKVVKMMMPSVTQQDQYRYKYLLSVDGNTAGWDRPIWIANSKSLLMKYASDQMLWYYPMLQEDHHYVGVDTNSMMDKYNFLQNNPAVCQWMIANANDFVRNYASSLAATLYMTQLFENVAFNK